MSSSIVPDVEKGGAAAQYDNEPARHRELIQRSAAPYNLETPAHHLESFITPTELFFVRNHLPVPEIDPATYSLKLGGHGFPRVLSLSLPELQANFPKRTLAATIQCAGNRRSEMSAYKAVRGLSWATGAVGNATWGGAALADVLKHAGFDAEHPQAQHFHFIGLDTDRATGQVYEVSVPADLVTSPKSGALLAWEMNGAPLTRDHGAPLRLVAPGLVGARQVKWLGAIQSHEKECEGQWQQRDYKAFSPNVDWDNVDWAAAPAIIDSPVQSAITAPLPGTSPTLTRDGKLPVRGWAWAGGGRPIIRVDVSADGGKTWTTAKLDAGPSSQRGDRAKLGWAWTMWQAEVPLPGGTKEVEVVAKATDGAYNSQPDSVAGIWNLRGMVNNAWHRVKVNV